MKRCWRLSRGQRTVRNLLLAALLLTLIWGLAGYPLSGELEIRRLEREYLAGGTKVVLVHRTKDGVALLAEGDSWITAGKATKVQFGDWPISLRMVPVLNQVLPKEGLVVVALPGPDENNAMTVAVWGAPPEAVSGTLELDLVNVSGGVWTVPAKETFTAQAARREDGWLLFSLAPHEEHDGWLLCAMAGLWEWDARILYGFVGEHPYRLTLRDEQGTAVETHSGTLPPNQCLIRWE